MYIPKSQPLTTETLPTMYDLPSEDPEEPGLPDEFHRWQAEFLCATCCPPNYPENQVFVASDLNLYYDVQHFGWYKRPDWFVAVGVSRFAPEENLRLSYVIWQERVSPLVAVELLSPGTEDEDLGITESEVGKPPTKWQVYEQILQIPYYLVFSRSSDRLRVFSLKNNRYREQLLSTSRFWIPELELGLGLWFGSYQGCRRLWLRWYDANNDWVPTSEERERLAIEREQLAIEREQLATERAQLAQQATERERLAKESALQQTQEERLAKESALQRAEKLAAQLRAMGINPDL